MSKQLTTFGAGCFWGVQQAFNDIPGVTNTVVGYAGGHVDNPTYEIVCAHKSGHAEVCQVEFDPEKLSYEKLLDAFWNMHDPTQLNRQGPDIGDQYRSVIFYHTREQKEIAEKSKEALDKSGTYDKPIATQIKEAPTFWPAEEYHQHYFKKNGGGGCHI